MKPRNRKRVHRLHRHRLGRHEARHLFATRHIDKPSSRRPRTQGPTRSSNGRSRLRKRFGAPSCRVRGAHQGAARLCAAEVRLLRALSRQSATAGEVPRSFHPAAPRTTRLTRLRSTSCSSIPRGSKRSPRKARRCERCSNWSSSVGAWSRQNRITNRLAPQAYFPQPLDWFEDKDTCCSAISSTRWPTAELARARAARVGGLLPATTCATRLASSNASRRSRRQAAHRRRRRRHGQRLRLTALVTAACGDPRIDHFDAEIAALCKRSPTTTSSAPCLAPACRSRHVCLPPSEKTVQRFASAAEIQNYAGVAPVTERSGKKHWVHWRLAAPTFLRQTFVEWAAQTIPDPSGPAPSIDSSAPRAARTRRRCVPWPSSGCASLSMLADANAYDESTYLNALKKRGSPLLNQLGMQT